MVKRDFLMSEMQVRYHTPIVTFEAGEHYCRSYIKDLSVPCEGISMKYNNYYFLIVHLSIQVLKYVKNETRKNSKHT